jgi:hypothetical protein
VSGRPGVVIIDVIPAYLVSLAYVPVAVACTNKAQKSIPCGGGEEKLVEGEHLRSENY